MNVNRVGWSLVALLTVGLACIVGCGGEERRCRRDDDCPAAQRCASGLCTSGSRVDSGAMDAPGAALDAPFVDAPPQDGGPPRDRGCSSDLRDVTDATGTVVESCPDDRGCSGGVCVPACTAADASRGTVGCRFLTSTPPAYPSALPSCFAAFVANTWVTPARLSVERAGRSYDVTRFGRVVDNTRAVTAWEPVPAAGLAPGSVAVLFLSSNPAAEHPVLHHPLHCPVTPAIDASTVAPDGSWETESAAVGDAFEIISDVPVRAYDILPFGGAPSHFPSAQLLLPTGVWGTEYLVTNARIGTHDQPGPMWIHVIALEDATSVTVQPTVPFVGGGGLPPAPAGAPTTFSLGQGRYAQFEMQGDPSGSLIRADRPVMVVAGNRFLRLQPMPGPGGESTHQQLVPVEALASEYVGAPYATRRADLAPETIPYRVVGAFDGTVLSYDPPVDGAPVRLSRGQVVDFESEQAFVIRSQDAMHPFALEQMMTSAQGMMRPGALAPEFGLSLGDEEAVVLVPPGQFLDEYLFFSDPSYPTTTLTVVRERAPEGESRETRVDCVGVLTGWQRVGASNFEWTTVDLLRGGVSVGTCRNGAQHASGDGPFGVMVWGLDSFSSYSYPAGGNAAQLAELDPLF